jgi:hypothetical protein
MQFGIDLSHHNPAQPWTQRSGCKFAICRSSYGLMKDRMTAQHIAGARAAGMKVGLYHFFRPSQDAQQQLDVFLHGLDAVKIGGGDIVPTLDVELDPLPTATPVGKAWQDGVRRVLDGLRDRYGNAMVYITQREFGMLGAPEWLLAFPLWVAHYTAAAKPATPGNRAWTLWQYRVGQYQLEGAGGYDKAHPELDQNHAVDLPLIGAVKQAPLAAPQHVDTDDTDLEDLIALHNQHLIDAFVEGEYAHLQEELNQGSGHAMREYEAHDTEPSPPPGEDDA